MSTGEESDQVAQRRANLEELRKLGVEPYPHRFEAQATVAAIVAEHGARSGEDLEAARFEVRTAGRILAIRSFGKANFLVLSDGTARIQVYLRQDSLPERDFQIFKLLDFGDWVGVSGHLFRTRTQEFTIHASSLAFLAKCLLPLPEKWHGLQDVEIRYRQRYLDLIVNPESRRVFEVRSRVVTAIREFLISRGFLEVETPMMQPIAGGALARPFVTHHNALDMRLYMRIAPELYLKRLTVGGIEKVFEINRNFRNEGISTQHNPEFTMLEFYWAYADYRQMMDLTEELLSGLAERVRSLLGREQLTWEGRAIDLARPWQRLTMREAITRYADVPAERLETLESVRAVLEEKGLPVPAGGTYGHLLMDLFEQTVEEHLFAPVFITDHPTDVSPLSKQRPDDPRFTERFELYLAGMEIANAFSELNDPDVQAERFRQQVAARATGDAEAHLYDADYVRALEHAMPPAAGIGIGIDRLTMLLTDRQSIRDVILFPLMRPEVGESDPAT